MESAEYIRKCTEERDNLENFLLAKGISIGKVKQELGETHFQKFVSGSLTMGEILEQATLAARQNDFGLAAQIAADAKIQKDKIYRVLIEALGYVPLQMTGSLSVIRDYIMLKYKTAIKTCEEILEGIYNEN